MRADGAPKLGNGDGTFAAPRCFAAEGASVALGDLDGDGNLDIATDTVEILFGDGIGGFGPSQALVTLANPGGVAVGDVDDDGDLDIVAANTATTTYEDGDLALLLNRGNAAFVSAGAIAAGGRPISAAIADVDADGLADLVAANLDEVSVILGTGGGKFGPALDFAVGSASNATAGDFDGDSDLDIATANNTGYPGNVAILLNTSVGVAPTISAIAPRFGVSGTEVTITGTGFTGAAAVLFRSEARRVVPADFTVISDTQIRSTVPAGAASGKIVVTTPAGTVSSPVRFGVLP
ncbi:MAG: VCBS repeat-containing protein [Aphanocapsa lilacina HA4352-LM1]|nr:VCBS repeat-containing protein [Aphanocapsa lilacina HA4352-LM1]